MAMSFTQIAKQMKPFRDYTKYERRDVIEIVTVPMVGVKMILYKGTVEGDPAGAVEVTGKKGIPKKVARYTTYAQFGDVKFSDKKEKENWIPVKVATKLMYYEPPRLSKNPVKIKCSCFTGDTLIPLADGTSIPIRDLIGRNEFFVFSYDVDCEKVVVGRAHTCEVKEENAKLLKITFDNGNSIRCTPDHEFLLKNGHYLRADQLTSGDSIEPLYRKLSDKTFMEGYEEVYQGSDKWETTHSLSDSYNIETDVYDKSAGTIRHHRNFNKRDNTPSNIQRMSWYEHNKLHHERMAGDKNPMKNPETVKKMRETQGRLGLHGKVLERWLAMSPGKRSEISMKAVETRRQRGQIDDFVKKCRVAGNTLEVRKRQSDTRKRKLADGSIDTSHGLAKATEVNRKAVTEGRHHFQTDEHRERVRKQMIDAQKDGSWSLLKSKNFKKANVLRNWLISLSNGSFRLTSSYQTKFGYSQFHHFLDAIRRHVSALDLPIQIMKRSVGMYDLVKEDPNFNHKVVSVKEDGCEDVYCFTVEKYGNFAVDIDGNTDCSSGVFVHNCPDFRFGWEKPLHDKKSLIGNWRRYIRKTKDRPERNPKNILGFCKHISALIRVLIGAGLVQGKVTGIKGIRPKKKTVKKKPVVKKSATFKRKPTPGLKTPKRTPGFKTPKRRPALG